MRKGCGHWTFQRCDCLIRCEETTVIDVYVRRVTHCQPILKKTRTDESMQSSPVISSGARFCVAASSGSANSSDENFLGAVTAPPAAPSAVRAAPRSSAAAGSDPYCKEASGEAVQLAAAPHRAIETLPPIPFELQLCFAGMEWLQFVYFSCSMDRYVTPLITIKHFKIVISFALFYT